MRSIIIVTEKPLDLSKLDAAYKADGETSLQAPDRLVVEGGWGWFALNRENAIEEEFDKSELEALRERIQVPTLSFAQLEFSNPRAGGIAVLGLPIDDKIIIDNDHGLISPIEEVKKRIRQGEDWFSATS